jgi:hypothetical protein
VAESPSNLVQHEEPTEPRVRYLDMTTQEDDAVAAIAAVCEASKCSPGSVLAALVKAASGAINPKMKRDDAKSIKSTATRGSAFSRAHP